MLRKELRLQLLSRQSYYFKGVSKLPSERRHITAIFTVNLCTFGSYFRKKNVSQPER